LFLDAAGGETRLRGINIRTAARSFRVISPLIASIVPLAAGPAWPTIESPSSI